MSFRTRFGISNLRMAVKLPLLSHVASSQLRRSFIACTPLPDAHPAKAGKSTAFVLVCCCFATPRTYLPLHPHKNNRDENTTGFPLKYRLHLIPFTDLLSYFLDWKRYGERMIHGQAFCLIEYAAR